MELKDFVGLHEYGGVELGTNPENDAEYVIFMLDGNCYKIEEDPDDGWRSYAKDVEEYHGEMSRRCILPYPIKVVCCMDDNPDNNILKFMDVENGKIFLLIGTEHTDDWYPNCRFEYNPENIHLNETDNSFSFVVANSKALEICGITEDMKSDSIDFENGLISSKDMILILSKILTVQTVK